MARPPLPAQASHRNDHPSTPSNLGYFHLRLVGSAGVNGRPVRAGTHTGLAVGDEISVLRHGTRYGFVVERFVSCGEGEPTSSCKGEGLVLRAESLRKRLRAISERNEPLHHEP